MRVRREKLEEIARSYKAMIETEKISSITELEARVGTSFTVKAGEIIQFELKPSNNGTSAYTVSYVILGTGIPLELKINPSLGYTKVIVKSEGLLEGFTQFGSDHFGNLMQDRTVEYSGVPGSIEEFLFGKKE